MAPAALNSRAVEVIYEGHDEEGPFREVGSGSFVCPHLVLTASHCIPPGPGKLCVRFPSDERVYPAVVRLQADKDKVDLAVLEVSDVTVEVPALRYGEVDRNVSGTVKECRAIGFPRFKSRNNKSVTERSSAQVDGEIPTGDNYGQSILTLQITNKDPRSLPDGKSEWAGISGAVVFSSNDIIIGVLTEHHLSEGERALAVVPITAINKLPDATKWWDLLCEGRPEFVSLPERVSSSVAATLCSYITINSIPPPTAQTVIQQRTAVVKEILRELTKPDLNALVLTAIGGAGKSTLAALIDHSISNKQEEEADLFAEPPIWLRIEATTTFTDLIGTLFQVLGQPLPNLNNLAGPSQAQLLYTILSMTSSRLIVLDQFENLLVWETAEVRLDRPGVGEWLDSLNSQPFQKGCRLLLTSRIRPKRDHLWAYIKEYQVKGLEIAEGKDLLEKLGVQATEADLYEAVKRCDGHALTLTLLYSLLTTHNIALRAALRDPTYSRTWEGNIAYKMLEEIYKELTPLQLQILLAFSVYRKPVHLDAVVAILPDIPEPQLNSNIGILLVQHLLQALGEGYYQLHGVISSAIQSYFAANMRHEAHRKAAQYYQKKAMELCPPLDERRSINDIQPLIEAMWQFCQAEQWKQAYGLMEQENLFISLKRFGGNAILLELFQLLLPLDKWQPNALQTAHIYNYLGDVYRTLGEMEQALKYLKQALSICDEEQTHGIEEGLPLNWVLNNLGRFYSTLGQWKLARKYVERALEVCRKLGNAKDINNSIETLKNEATTLNDLAKIYKASGNRKQAVEYCKQALDLSRKLKDQGKEATTLKNLGDIYSSYKATRYKKRAQKYFEEALDIQRKEGIYGEEGLTLSSLGKLYYDLRDKARAQEYLIKALAIRRAVGDPLSEAQLLYYIGMFRFEHEEYKIALACFLRAEEIFNIIQNPESHSVQKSLQELSQKLNQKQFNDLMTEVKPQLHQIIENTLIHAK